ncbi:hypothetical protein EJ04DRAFT_456901 [Polyplosphaeria fusca]|uniref:rRNA methyltransferase 1, mitochondrial n=1 Tax=Polyplosphaeria fusca TaxID=682080 RepID=A0A9P4RA56_9PLEO|nr:hypothetical protein EJ04DRAFT_456901 [Polyplosphaeria fusca]
MKRAYLHTRPVLNVRIGTHSTQFSRPKSIRAAIERGIRHSGSRSERTTTKLPEASIRQSRFAPRQRSPFERVARAGSRTRAAQASVQEDRGQGKLHTRTQEYTQVRETTDHARRSRPRQSAPDILPYKSAASEFLFGYSVVLAALKAGRRKIYTLYIHERGQSRDGQAVLVARARALQVKIHEVGDDWLPVLDKASKGRPHNGVILETSPLPQPPITELLSPSRDMGQFGIKLDVQSREDLLVNGKQEQYGYTSSGWRYPLILYVDGVLDEGNLGAMARSAYFLGVDALITPTRNSAPWSAIALKASAGAAEALPIFTVNKPADFLSKSARSGWRVYATDALPPELTKPGDSATSAGGDENAVVYTYAQNTKRLLGHSPVATHPTILMMGAEGTGLRSSLLTQANFKVGIKAGRGVDEAGVDSLNVSVAASLLCFDMLKKPMERTPGNALF